MGDFWPIGSYVVLLEASRDLTGNEHPQHTLGRVTQHPDAQEPRYAVTLLDGRLLLALPEQLALHRTLLDQGIAEGLPAADLWPWIAYRCVVGSRAYGLDDVGSDFDRRGFYLPPASLHWSLAGVPEQLVDERTADTYWEFEKFVRLALKANPTVLECLFTPMVEFATPLAQELLAMREAFLSRLVYQTYNGYVMSQFRLAERDLRQGRTVKPKHAMHLIRLLLSGITLLREGDLPLQLPLYRERLLQIKHGEMQWDAVELWRKQLHGEFEQALSETRLPATPDYARVNAFVLRARRQMLDL